MKTFKCWLIANFEIFMLLLTAITGSIIFWGFSGIGEETAFSAYCSILLVLLLTIPTKRGAVQLGKYILMLGGMILLTWGIRNQGWIDDVADKELFNRFITWFWSVFSIATAISAWLAYYTYVNIDEVVSLRMLYRNSEVSLFEFSLLYTLDRFCSITLSIVACVLQLIFLIFSIRLNL